jgi:hypothetical protein
MCGDSKKQPSFLVWLSLVVSLLEEPTLRAEGRECGKWEWVIRRMTDLQALFCHSEPWT